MPLAWAHVEHVKLLRSLADGRVFDMPSQPRRRYQIQDLGSRYALWRFNHRCTRIPAGRFFRVEISAPGSIQWSSDAWHTSRETPTRDSGFGMQYADLDTAELAAGREVLFTVHTESEAHRTGCDHKVAVD